MVRATRFEHTTPTTYLIAKSLSIFITFTESNHERFKIFYLSCAECFFMFDLIYFSVNHYNKFVMYYQRMLLRDNGRYHSKE